MKKILVTGGAGFIGSNLIKTLIKSDNYIIALDNLCTGNLKNIEYLTSRKNFEFIKHDIINPIDIKADEIYNLACPASPDKYQIDSEFTFKTSVFGVYNLLQLAKKYNAKFLQASTSEVYGNPRVHPQNEEYSGNVNCIGIRACYDEGKRASETLISDFTKKYGIKTKIARIFNTYGPNMDKNDGRIISNFINQALENKDITIYGTGEQTRSLCYIDDTVNGLIKLMNSSDEINFPINIGNTDERTVKNIADIVLNLTSSKSDLTYTKPHADDPLRRCPDITKAEKFLNWEPVVNLEEGLKRTIKYFKDIKTNNE